MEKCVCGRELEHGKSLCYVCETLLLLSPEQQAEYLKIDVIKKMGGKENDAQSGFRGTIKQR